MLIPLHRGVNLDRGPHRRREVDGLLANHAVDYAVAVHAVLDLATLDVPDGPADVLSDGAALRVGHEPARTQGLAQGTDDPHLVWGGDGHIELHEAFVPDAGGQVFGADHVRAGLLGLPRLLADGEDGDAA